MIKKTDVQSDALFKKCFKYSVIAVLYNNTGIVMNVSNLFVRDTIPLAPVSQVEMQQLLVLLPGTDMREGGMVIIFYLIN